MLGLASAAEVMQALGLPLLGRTFDRLDFLMYAGGVVLAAAVDRLLACLLPGWSLGRTTMAPGAEE